MSFPFVVRETTGPGRAIILKGRSLPYQGVNYGGTQRVNVNYFVGNPVASAQVLGPTYKPTQIRGKWKDIFLLGPGPDQNVNAPTILNFPNIGVAGIPATPGLVRTGETFPSAASIPGNNQVVQRARTARDAFELIRRSGQLLKVEWGSIVRYGFITDADFIHDREEDIEWMLEFTWIGDTDAPPKVRFLPKLDPLGLLKQLLKLLQSLLDTLVEALLKVQFAVLGIQQAIRSIGALVTGLIEVLQKFASLALVPLEVIGNIKQQLTAIALAAKDLIGTIRAVPAAYAAAANGAGSDLANLATLFAQAIAFNASQLGAEAVRQRRELDRITESNLLGLYVSPGGVTLRDVSTQFYGSPANWGAIADFNGFASSTLPQGTVVRVPRL